MFIFDIIGSNKLIHFIHNFFRHSHPIKEKWLSFGWHVILIDGHNIKEIHCAFDEAQKVLGVPTVIIAKTVKGKGVSFMEGKAKYHGAAPTAEELTLALSELGCAH